jgi:hypothetical protein
MIPRIDESTLLFLAASLIFDDCRTTGRNTVRMKKRGDIYEIYRNNRSNGGSLSARSDCYGSQEWRLE